MPEAEIELSFHAISKLEARGTTREEILEVLKKSEEQQVKKGRKAKEAIFKYNEVWHGKFYE